jgi:predicted N-acyltransferase
MMSDLRIRVLPAMADIPAAAWDACANPNSNSQEKSYNPFISHAFLSALEASGSAAARTGWQPQHLIAETEDGAVLGAVPAYLKSHSRGEYVFDAGWAEAYERAGGSYYPSSRSRCRSRRRPGGACWSRRARARTDPPGMAKGLIELARMREPPRCMSPSRRKTNGACSASTASSAQRPAIPLGECGYATFDDFLGALAARKRKAIRRERAGAGERHRGGLAHGSDLTESVWDTSSRSTWRPARANGAGRI